MNFAGAGTGGSAMARSPGPSALVGGSSVGRQADAGCASAPPALPATLSASRLSLWALIRTSALRNGSQSRAQVAFKRARRGVLGRDEFVGRDDAHVIALR